MRYLRKKDDGYIYVWTPHLAERDDMEEVVETKPTEKVEEQSNLTEMQEIGQKLIRRGRRAST